MTENNNFRGSLRRTRWRPAIIGLSLLIILVGWMLVANRSSQRERKNIESGEQLVKPALTVTAVLPKQVFLPQVLSANGTIGAWEEVVIGAEVTNLRLTEVLVNVGDHVKKGKLLARFASEIVVAELSQSRALLAEAEALLIEARANAERARRMQATTFFSAQQINQYLTAEEAALARVNAARARVEANQIRLSQTRIVAPNDGVISMRTATVGSLGHPGSELFKLIREGRLEWRAEVTESDLDKIKPGTIANLIAPDGAIIQGRLRMIAPTVDAKTRFGIAYVDLPTNNAGTGIRAGTFVKGEFELGRSFGLILPQSAVLVRDGFFYVFRIEANKGAGEHLVSNVSLIKVSVGRRYEEYIEVISGIGVGQTFVNSGVAFLSDGDLVRVVKEIEPLPEDKQ